MAEENKKVEETKVEEPKKPNVTKVDLKKKAKELKSNVTKVDLSNPPTKNEEVEKQPVDEDVVVINEEPKKEESIAVTEITKDVLAAKMKALDAFSNALADMNRAFVALAKIDQEAGNSGSGDLTDQLATVDKYIENLYQVDRRMFDIIPK